MAKTPFTGKNMRSNELLGLVHSDVCGPMSVSARGGFSYFVTFTDDHSRYGYVFLIKHKSEVFEKFKEFKSVAENQTGILEPRVPGVSKGTRNYLSKDTSLHSAT